MPRVGDIWLDTDFFGDGTKRKFLLVLAIAPDGDVVHRLLTSKPKGRPEDSHCYHGNPFCGFYMGVIGGPLTRPSWLDLDDRDDLDDHVFARWVATGKLQYVMQLGQPLLCEALRCFAGAPDTSGRQRNKALDSIALLRCP
jgi:hypothetical protein